MGEQQLALDGVDTRPRFEPKLVALTFADEVSEELDDEGKCMSLTENARAFGEALGRAYKDGSATNEKVDYAILSYVRALKDNDLVDEDDERIRSLILIAASPW